MIQKTLIMVKTFKTFHQLSCFVGHPSVQNNLNRNSKLIALKYCVEYPLSLGITWTNFKDAELKVWGMLES